MEDETFAGFLYLKHHTELFANSDLETLKNIQNCKIGTYPLQVIIQTVTKESDDQFYSRFVHLEENGTDLGSYVFIILLYKRNKGHLC